MLFSVRAKSSLWQLYLSLPHQEHRIILESPMPWHFPVLFYIFIHGLCYNGGPCFHSSLFFPLACWQIPPLCCSSFAVLCYHLCSNKHDLTNTYLQIKLIILLNNHGVKSHTESVASVLVSCSWNPLNVVVKLWYEWFAVKSKRICFCRGCYTLLFLVAKKKLKVAYGRVNHGSSNHLVPSYISYTEGGSI